MHFLQAKLHVCPDTHSQFHKARPIPFAIKEAIEQVLDHLESSGVIQRLTHSEWAASIVPVPKKNERFCICGDFKVSINPTLDIDQHPLHKPEDLFATLAGGMKFTKLDLSQAYQQLTLDEESKPYTSQSTHIVDCINTTAYFLASHLLLLFFQRPWIQSFKGFHMSFATVRVFKIDAAIRKPFCRWAGILRQTQTRKT